MKQLPTRLILISLALHLLSHLKANNEEFILSAKIDSNIYYLDFDEDGFGDAEITILDVSPPSGYVENAMDCNDQINATNPAAVETCNNHDDDCDLEIDEDAILEIGFIRKNVSCNGAVDGNIFVYPLGGLPPYTYIWSNGSTDDFIQGLDTGVYRVTITATNGCQRQRGFRIKEPDVLQTSYESVLVSTNPERFNVIINPNGGSPYVTLHPYRYRRFLANANSWSSWRVDSLFANLFAGTHFFQIRDKRSCIEELTITLGSGNLLQQGTRAVPIEGQDLQLEDTEIAIFPNPTAHYLSFYRESPVAIRGKISILNNLGELMLEQVFSNWDDENSLTIEFQNKLSNGLYYVKIHIINQREVVRKFVVLKE